MFFNKLLESKLWSTLLAAAVLAAGVIAYLGLHKIIYSGPGERKRLIGCMLGLVAFVFLASICRATLPDFLERVKEEEKARKKRRSVT